VEKTAEVATAPKTETPKKLSYQEQQDWAIIEQQIEESEVELEQLEADLASAGSDLGKVNELYQAIEKTKATLDERMEYWTYLSEKIEAFENHRQSHQ
ncbi:MAG TPA: multidrug ABC transporter ATP-binding protein, partial [Exiguobacterium sp.]